MREHPLETTKRFVEHMGMVKYNAISRKEVAWRIAYALRAVCEIAGCSASGGYGKLVFDHCHAHGWVRGLICISHNAKLGWIESVMAIDGIVVDLSKTVYADFLANCPDCRGK